jgi:hypothetical protein
MFALNSNKTHTENCLQTRKTRRSGTSGWRAQSPDLTGRRSSPSAFPKRGGRVLAVGAQAAQSPDLTGRVLRPSQIASLDTASVPSPRRRDETTPPLQIHRHFGRVSRRHFPDPDVPRPDSTPLLHRYSVPSSGPLTRPEAQAPTSRPALGFGADRSG